MSDSIKYFNADLKIITWMIVGQFFDYYQESDNVSENVNANDFH